MRPEMMTRPQEDAEQGSSVDVVGGGEFSGYEAWKSNKDISGIWGNDGDEAPAPKSKL